LLRECCDELHVIATRPRLRASAFGSVGTVDVGIPAFSARTLLSAAAEIVTHPGSTASALRRIAAPSYSGVAKLKNIALFPKALAVARYVREKRIEHIHAHWMTTPATIAYVASTITGVPWSCTAHAHDIFADNLLSEKGGSARAIRVISNTNCREFNERTRYRYAARTHVVHLGVELPQTPAPCAMNGTLRILAPARLHPIKGHTDLLDGLARLQARHVPFHCTLAGDGELYADIAARIARMGLGSCVTMRGLVEHSILLDEMHRGEYDVIALTSVVDTSLPEQFEGIPVSLMEAMAAGVPCIATETGSIPELITAQTGILVNQRDPAALAEALERLAADAGLRRRLGLAARERIAQHFNVAVTTRALYSLMRGPVSSPANIPAANAN
jgi:glycosyltransferase involved in cell wall biosynthesis